jgi:hypothetical protein
MENNKPNISMKKHALIFSTLILLACIVNPVHGQWKKLAKKDLSVRELRNDTASFPDNMLTEREVKEGWKLLFDGKSTDGWMNAGRKTTPATGWEVKEGTIVISSATRGKDGGGDIVTVDKFGNFELIVDFKYGKGANSGIKYFVDTESNNGSLSSIGCEYQVIDDIANDDAKAGTGGNHSLSALYDLIAPANKRDNGSDNWNRATIIVNGTKGQHWLNGQLTVEYERGTDAWRELVAKSKFKNSPGFGQKNEGRILLQDHPGYVAFKNIKIREIK